MTVNQKLQQVIFKTSRKSLIMDEEFDLFHMPGNPSASEQRDFEIWWRKMTGRAAIVISGVDYKTTLNYPEESK